MAHQYARFDTIIGSVLGVLPFFIVDEILKSSLVFPVNFEDLKNGSDLSATRIAERGNIMTTNGIPIVFPLLGFMMTLFCKSLKI